MVTGVDGVGTGGWLSLASGRVTEGCLGESLKGEPGGGSPTSCVSAFSPNKVTLTYFETSPVNLDPFIRTNLDMAMRHLKRYFII